MKRIAFVNLCFTGSILPLVRQYVGMGYDVDLYEYPGSFVKELEAFTCKPVPTEKGLNVLPRDNYEHLREYMNIDKFRVFSVETVRPFNRVPVLRELVGFYRRQFLLGVARKINEIGYEFVNIVSQYWDVDYITLLDVLTCPVIVSLHEVCDHRTPNFDKTPRYIRAIANRRVPIVVFSDKSREDLLRYKEIDERLVHVVRFGLFESYKYMLAADAPDSVSGRLEEKGIKDYFLFIGGLKPYKGIKLFVEAIKCLRARRPELTFVIAGGGYDASIEDVKDMDNVLLINHYIGNKDFAVLMEKCRAVVCPYTSASQSGIPQTAFVFGKPVVASRIKSFEEVLCNDRFGVICDLNSVESLVASMEKMQDDNVLYDSIVKNIAGFEQHQPEYDWAGIAYNLKQLATKK